jgi:hypothetical protein
MCKLAGKTTDHLLLHCCVARELWSMVFTLFGVHWVMLKVVVECLASWQSRFGRISNSAIWNVIPHCLMWCISCEQSARNFEGCENLFQT